MKLKKLLKEGAYESATRDELALYLTILHTELEEYKKEGNQAIVKLLTQDIEDVKAMLEKKRASGLKEVEETNDRVAYKDKNNPNFLYIDVKYTTGMGGFLTALGSDTMSGSARKKGLERALVIAKDTAEELEKQYNIEDIGVEDLENGKVQIFAVSDDFINVDPKTDSKLKTIVNKFKHTL